MTLDDLRAFVAIGPDKLARVFILGQRLEALDKERAEIAEELAALGVAPSGQRVVVVDPQAAEILPPDVPRCVTCGEVGTLTVDDDWYCDAHDPKP